MITKNIYMDAWNPAETSVTVQQGEVNARFLHVHLMNNGLPLNLEGCAAAVYCTKPDGTTIFNTCEITDAAKGQITVPLTQQMGLVPGILRDMELRITDADSVLKVRGLQVRIRASGDYDAAVESTDEFTALQTALNASGCYLPEVRQPASGVMELSFTPTRPEMPAVAAQTVALPEGPAGPQGPKGDTYTLTDTDRADIADRMEHATVAQAPQYVERMDQMTDTDQLYVLPDGYIYAFTAGGTQEVFTDVLKEVGYTADTRFNSSGALVTYDGNFTTGYIAVKPGDVIRMKNMYVPDTFNENGSTYGQRVAAYTAEKVFIDQKLLCYVGDGSTSAFDRVVENGNVVQFTVAPSVLGENVAYIIIGANEITANSEIYVNSTFVAAETWMNTGISYAPGDYEARVTALENEVDHLGGTAVPDYWRTELEIKADAIRIAMENAGPHKSAFLWYTDAHWQTNAKTSPALLRYLQMYTPMNKINFGGDIINDPTSFTHDNIPYAYDWRGRIAGLRNHHSVPGNHDLNHNATDVRNMAYAFLLAPEESADMVRGDGLYYYIDNNAERTRYLYLDYITNDGAAMLAQGQFIVDALKTAPDGWHIVAIAHRWFQYTSASAPTVGAVPMFEGEMLDIFDEYNARGKHTASNCFYAQDFADGKAKVEFCIGGHIHADYDFRTDGGIPVIITASDTNQERSGDETEDCGTVGTTTEAAVFGIVADYTNGKITVVGVGRGTSREIER